MSKLPTTWAKVCLEDVASWGSGGTPSRKNPEYFVGTIPWLKTGELGQKYIRSTEEHISQEAVRSSAAKLFPKGSVCIAMYGATIGKASILGLDATTNQACAVGSPHASVLDAEFLYYFLVSEKRRFVDAGIGGAQPNISQGLIKSWHIPLAPLAEQKRIVAKIEELFSELEAGEESLRTARRQLATYRQSLLKQAFQGHLTKCSRIESVPLRALITDLGQGWSPKCELNRSPAQDEWAVIKTTAIQHCRYDDTEAKPLPPPFKPRPSIEIKDGDFLMTRKGPRVRAGVSCYVRKTRPRLMICDTVYRFRCVETKVFPLYLELALNSPDVLHAIDQRKAGINESGLSLTHAKLGSIEIPLCPLPEQREIVRLLDEQFEVIERNEREIDAALRRSEALRQSILHRAFTGHLVPQDPADEPATQLLARLRAEKQSAPLRKPTSRKSKL